MQCEMEQWLPLQIKQLQQQDVPPRETLFNSASYRVLHREIMVTHSLK